MLIYAVLGSSFYGHEQIVRNASNFAFFDFHNILSSLLTLVIGGIIYIVFRYFNLFDKKLPSWLSIEYLIYNPAGRLLFYMVNSGFSLVDSAIDSTYRGLAKFFITLVKKLHLVNDTIEHSPISSGAKEVFEKTAWEIESPFKNRCERAGKVMSSFLIKHFRRVLNLNVSVFIFAVVVVILMFIFIQYTPRIKFL
jgi:hypothetical protein